MDRSYRLTGNGVVVPPSPKAAVLGQFARFVLAGGSANAVYAVVFLALTGVGEQLANGAAAVVSAVLASELHRRFTFRVRGRVGWRTAQWQGGATLAAGLAASSAALAWLDFTAPDAGALVPLVVAGLVHGTVGLVRFATLRWLFGARSARSTPVAVLSPVAVPVDRSVPAALAA